MLLELPSSLIELIRMRLGIEESTVGRAALLRIVQQQMAGCGMDSIAEYVQALSADEDLWMQLTEELLIPESWFFRDGRPFDWLGKWVSEHWIPSNPGKVLRILSVPCAGGQEPYSIVMTLLESGMQLEQFVVESGDLSARSLAIARKACYRRHAFRGDNRNISERYFKQIEADVYQLCESVRSKVSFRRFNLVEEDCFAGLPLFDVIFCRNVLIYFNDRARRLALSNIRRCLHQEGRIVVGHADSILSLSSELVVDGDPGAFCYRLRPPIPAATTAAESLKGRPWTSKQSRSGHKGKLARVPVNGPQLGKETKKPQLGWSLARELADSGQLEQAATVCEQLLSTEGSSIDGLLLQGAVQLGLNQPEAAERAFRRVVYLDPANKDALLQLTLLAERRGLLSQAQRWRKRLQRSTGELSMHAPVTKKEDGYAE